MTKLSRMTSHYGRHNCPTYENDHNHQVLSTLDKYLCPMELTTPFSTRINILHKMHGEWIAILVLCWHMFTPCSTTSWHSPLQFPGSGGMRLAFGLVIQQQLITTLHICINTLKSVRRVYFCSFKARINNNENNDDNNNDNNNDNNIIIIIIIIHRK